jgi:hypothetical protein
LFIDFSSSFQGSLKHDKSDKRGCEAAEGVADSGHLGDDLTDLLLALDEAAREQDSGERNGRG